MWNKNKRAREIVNYVLEISWWIIIYIFTCPVCELAKSTREKRDRLSFGSSADEKRTVCRRRWLLESLWFRQSYLVGKLTEKFKAADMNKISPCTGVGEIGRQREKEKLKVRNTARTLLVTISSTRTWRMQSSLCYLDCEAL